jgi:hypothetical protein
MKIASIGRIRNWQFLDSLCERRAMPQDAALEKDLDLEITDQNISWEELIYENASLGDLPGRDVYMCCCSCGC